MQVIGGFTSYREESNSNEGRQFARTNYVLKESVSKDWSYYQLNGLCEVKPYPVFENGKPCPSRKQVAIEQQGNVDLSKLTDEDKRRYAVEAVPPAFIYLPSGIVSYAGVKDEKQHFSFINHVTDMDRYEMTGTPYDCMLTVLFRRTPKKGDPCTDKHLVSVNKAKLEGTLSSPRESLLFRCALLRYKGEDMQTKKSVDGMLPKTVFAVSQKSAVSNFLRSYLKPANPMQPLSSDNCVMSHIMPVGGTTLVFSKVGADKASDYEINPSFNQTTNANIMRVWSAGSEQEYMANVYNSFGAAQSVFDMLELLTAEEMVEMLAQAYPASWLWFGLRDTNYAPLVQKYADEANRDMEFVRVFNGGAAPAAQPTWQAPLPTSTMPTIADLPPAMNQLDDQDEVPMYTAPAVSPDQQEADDVMARLRAKVNFGGN